MACGHVMVGSSGKYGGPEGPHQSEIFQFPK